MNWFMWKEWLLLGMWALTIITYFRAFYKWDIELWAISILFMVVSVTSTIWWVIFKFF